MQKDKTEFIVTDPEQYDKIIKIGKREYKTVKLPDGAVVAGELQKKRKQKSKPPKAGVLDGMEVTEKNASGLFWKNTGYGIPLNDERYIRVMKKRWLAIIGIILLAAALFTFIFWLITGQNPVRNAVDYVGDQTGVVETNKDVKGTVEGYTSFESTPDQTWAVGELEQKMTIRNLAGNAVDVCPHVYVDTNKDGKFSDDECVYNVPEYDDNGNVTNDTTRIAPGHEIDTITLTHALEKGDYDAQIVYTTYFTGTDNAANGMNFTFHVSVE